MEPVVTTEQLEELPWGPGALALLEPLEIEIEEDAETETVAIHARDLNITGDGSNYTEALLDFAGAVEATVDELRSAQPEALDEAASELLLQLDKYVPYEDD